MFLIFLHLNNKGCHNQFTHIAFPYLLLQLFPKRILEFSVKSFHSNKVLSSRQAIFIEITSMGWCADYHALETISHIYHNLHPG